MGGPGHTSLVTGLAASAEGKVFSVGFDDCVKEIDGGKYTYAFVYFTLFFCTDYNCEL